MTPDLNDKQLLRRLLDSGRLSDQEDEAFARMYRGLKHGHVKSLSPRQRQWAEETYARLELDAEEGAQNLVSSGLVRPSSSMPALDYEKMHRPLKPPVPSKG